MIKTQFVIRYVLQRGDFRSRGYLDLLIGHDSPTELITRLQQAEENLKESVAQDLVQAKVIWDAQKFIKESIFTQFEVVWFRDAICFSQEDKQ